MAKRQKDTLEQRAAEYVDSELMTQRLKSGKTISALIHGNYGAYRTSMDLKGSNGGCTCPSDFRPCKHMVALQKTWKKKPESFLDLESFLAELQGRTKANLIEVIGEMIHLHPPVLSLFGVSGFEDEGEEDDYDYDDEY